MYSGGYMGRICRIDLSERSYQVEPLSNDLARDFLGGAGVGIQLLYDLVPPATDPLSSKNALIFAPGPLTGTTVPTASRMAVVTRSPLTGAIAMANSGGYFPAEIKFAGYDAIVIEGAAETPVYINIRGDQIRFHSAEELWGTRTFDCEALIQEESKDRNTRVACIGPAGERLSLISAIINERRAAGRKGVGAVMGSKKLKAIAIRGNERVSISDPEGYKEALSILLRSFKASPTLYPDLGKYGTSTTVETTCELGIFPLRNFSATGEYDPSDKIGGYVQHKDFVRKEGCYRCPVSCHIFRKVDQGPYAGYLTDGPEFETDYSLGGTTGINDAGAIYAADRLCDEYGLDTISTGATIAFAMELFERGLLNLEDTDGLELRFGNNAAMIEMVRKIAFREGLGDLLADGVRRAVEEFGPESEYYALHVKGLELPGYDVRGAKAHGLNYATAYPGADHNRGFAGQEIFGGTIPIEVDRFTLEDKAGLTKWNQDMKTALCDCPTLCAFLLSDGETLFDSAPQGLSDELTENRLQNLVKLINSTTGLQFSPSDLRRLGERVNTLARAFNMREGFSRKDDTLPMRLMKEHIKAGPSEGAIFSQDQLDQLLDEYYALYGYDENGTPTRERLEELDLGYVADELAGLNKISK
jgi:aldehyde:ferredoxin oxidoreductase